jgi:hypothetical protein
MYQVKIYDLLNEISFSITLIALSFSKLDVVGYVQVSESLACHSNRHGLAS